MLTMLMDQQTVTWFVRRMIEKKKKKLRNNYYQCSAYVGSNEPSKKKLRKPMLR